MAFALIDHTIASSTAGFSVTSSGINTTGADLITIMVSDSSAFFATIVLSDNKTNTWTARTFYDDGGNPAGKLFYCVSPSVGSGHTFSIATGRFPTIAIAAWSGSHATPVDQETGTVTTATTISTGSITPSVDNCLVIAACAVQSQIPVVSAGTPVMLDSVAESGNAWGAGLAYEIQTTATAGGVTFSHASSTHWAATIISFKPATGGGGGATYPGWFTASKGGWF